jgi:hypothetical protein
MNPNPDADFFLLAQAATPAPRPKYLRGVVSEVKIDAGRTFQK